MKNNEVQWKQLGFDKEEKQETGFPIALVIQIVLAIISYLITKATCKADRDYLTELGAQLDRKDLRR